MPSAVGAGDKNIYTMKIALLTIHAADNYGATLQAYATQRKLEELGHDVEIIDLHIDNPYSKAKGMLLYPKHLKFEKFRKKYYHHLTRKYASLEDLQNNPPQADCYMVGSDQTWNPVIARGQAKAFFLDFGNEDVLKASYAASFGMQKWEDSEWIKSDDASKLLKRITKLSVREKDGMDILKRDLGIEHAVQVVDPVLLFDNYPELVGHVDETNELILYKLSNSDAFYEKAKNIALDLSVTPRSIGSIRRIKGVKCGYPEGVEEWIRRIAGAKYVMTDSFHGMIFSILYQRQFILYARTPKLISRMVSILSLLGIQDRIVSGDASAEEIKQKLVEPVDYQTVQKRLVELRSSSVEFLMNIDK